jgi:hypothetical protein
MGIAAGFSRRNAPNLFVQGYPTRIETGIVQG